MPASSREPEYTCSTLVYLFTSTTTSVAELLGVSMPRLLGLHRLPDEENIYRMY